jgi:site-specific DNA recombinase
MPFAPEYLHMVFPGVVFNAWLYGRNSDDATKTGDSVEDQLATGRRLCDRHKWGIAQEFKDTGISASRHGKKARDDFEDLLAAITHTAAADGVRHIVVAYEASRYYRDLEAYVRLRKACLASNTLLCYNGQVYDLSRRDDRKATAMHAVDAEDEGEGIRDRNLRTATLQAEDGQPHGKLPYGYLREYAVVGGRKRCVRQYEHPVQGQFIVRALRMVDEGNSMLSVVRWLNSQPESLVNGKAWAGITVRRMLLNRRYLGERLHLGEYRKGTWEPLKGLETPQGRAMFNRVTDKLTDPARRTQRGTEVSHLLTFIALCGRCGDDHLLGSWPRAGGGAGQIGCKERRHVSIREDVANAYVEEAVITWFADKGPARAALLPDSAGAESKTAAAQRLINGYEEQLREARTLAKTFNLETGRPLLPAASLADLEQELGPKLEAERARLRERTGVSPVLLDLLAAADPDVVWNGRPATESRPAVPALSLEQKREVILKVVTIRLYGATVRGGRRIEMDRIRLSFVGEPGFRDRPLRARGSGHAGGPGLAVVSGSG